MSTARSRRERKGGPVLSQNEKSRCRILITLIPLSETSYIPAAEVIGDVPVAIGARRTAQLIIPLVFSPTLQRPTHHTENSGLRFSHSGSHSCPRSTSENQLCSIPA
jgi:hypothetical protein